MRSEILDDRNYRYIDAHGQHEVMLNNDGINIYTKSRKTCDDDLVGQIIVGLEGAEW